MMGVDSDMSNQNIDKVNQDHNNDENQLIFQTESQRKKYRQMLSDKEQHEHFDDDEDTTTAVDCF